MSETTWETIVERYKESAVRDGARIDELRQSNEHWHDTAQMLMRQRNIAEEERDTWKVRAQKAVQERHALRAERDALRKDAARMDWLADTVAIEGFGIDDVDAVKGCVGMDIYEHASIVADERGNDDDPTVSDQREGFRRMIDAALAVQPMTSTEDNA